MKVYREPNLLKEFYSNNKNNIEVYLKVRYLQKPIFFSQIIYELSICPESCL